jgi:hypothetical protein
MMLSFSRFEVRDADSPFRDVNLVPALLHKGSKSKRCSEPSPGTNLRRSIDLAARFLNLCRRMSKCISRLAHFRFVFLSSNDLVFHLHESHSVDAGRAPVLIEHARHLSIPKQDRKSCCPKT